MNTYRIALLVIMTACAVAQGAIPSTNAPPVWIPVGPMFRHWIVTNRPCNAPLSLEYLAKNGATAKIQNAGSQTNFPTYASLERYMANEGMRILGVVKANIQPNTPIRFRLTLFNADSILINSMLIDIANIGTASTIRSNSFIGLPTQWESAPLIVKGLERFTITVTSNSPVMNGYSYSWTPQTGGVVGRNFVSTYPPESTTTNLVVLNAWYAMNTNEVRYSITVGGKTMTYTQDGAALINPVPRLVGTGRFEIVMPLGANTIVECRDYEGDSWKKCAEFRWPMHMRTTVFTYDPSVTPMRQFRAYCN